MAPLAVISPASRLSHVRKETVVIIFIELFRVPRSRV
jgi:hypothetical protein